MRYILFLSFFFFEACDSPTQQAFDKNAMVANITQKIILPHYQSFITETNQLNAQAQTFSTSPTRAYLTDLQQVWYGSMSAWKKCELFNFGVAKDKNYMFDINFNEVRPKLIENVLNDTTRIDEEYVGALGSAAKGLPTVAFLLFENKYLPTLSALEKNQRSFIYLNGLTKNLSKNAQLLFEEWKNNYAQSFPENQDNISLNILANQLLALTENIALKRIDIIVKQTADSTKFSPLDKAMNDKRFILSNLKIIQEVFTGAGGVGFDDYLDFLNVQFAKRKLSVVINEQVEKSIKAIENVTDEEKARLAQEELKKLLILFKTDMFSALGIAVSFTDADGD
jgi:predicted lipoprotein